MSWHQVAGIVIVGGVAIVAAFIFISEFGVFASAVANGRASAVVAMQSGGLATAAGTLLLTSAGTLLAVGRHYPVASPWRRLLRWFRPRRKPPDGY